MSRRLTIASLVVLALAGFGVRAAGGVAADAIGFFIVGVAGVLAIAAVFYSIGKGEERERAAEVAATQRDDDGAGDEPGGDVSSRS